MYFLCTDELKYVIRLHIDLYTSKSENARQLLDS